MAGGRIARDRGLTLVELVVAVAILGMMSAFVVGAVTVVFRSQSGVTNTTASSHDVQQAVNFFYRDVQSGPVELAAYRTAGDGAGPTGSGCDEAGDDNVLRFDSDNRRVAYRLTDRGDDTELDRVVCVAEGSGWTEESSVNIADALASDGGDAVSVELVASDDEPTEVGRVVMSFTPVVGAVEAIAATPQAEPTAEAPAPMLAECADDPFSATQNFGSFIHGDAHLDNTNLRHAAAIGGALSFDDQLTIGQNLNRPDEYPTVAGLENTALLAGSIDWTATGSRARINIGASADAAVVDTSNSDRTTRGRHTFLHASGDNDRQPSVRAQNPGQLLTGSSWVDFDVAFASLRACADRLAGLPGICSCADHVALTNTRNRTYEGTANNATVRAVLTAGTVNTLNLTEQNLTELNSLRWSTVRPSATSPLIVNVSTGADATFNPLSVQSGGSAARGIIWNFPNVTGTLTITGRTVWGTVMAPYAHVVSDERIEGGLIARSVTFDGAFVNPAREFDGAVPWD